MGLLERVEAPQSRGALGSLVQLGEDLHPVRALIPEPLAVEGGAFVLLDDLLDRRGAILHQVGREAEFGEGQSHRSAG